MSAKQLLLHSCKRKQRALNGLSVICTIINYTKNVNILSQNEKLNQFLYENDINHVGQLV